MSLSFCLLICKKGIITLPNLGWVWVLFKKEKIIYIDGYLCQWAVMGKCKLSLSFLKDRWALVWNFRKTPSVPSRQAFQCWVGQNRARLVFSSEANLLISGAAEASLLAAPPAGSISRPSIPWLLASNCSQFFSDLSGVWHADMTQFSTGVWGKWD